MRDEPPRDLALYLRLLGQAKRYWMHLALLFVVSLLSTPLALLAPVPLKIVVDNVLGTDPLPAILAAIIPAGIAEEGQRLLVFCVVLVVVIALLTKAQQMGSRYLSSYIGERLVLDFRTRLFRHASALSFAYHDRHGTSDPTYRIQYDAESVRYVAIDGVIPFVTAATTFATMIYVTAAIDLRLALIALAVSPFLLVFIQLSRGTLRKQARAVKKLESSALAVVQEVLTSLRVVQAFGQEKREQRRFTHHSRQGMDARLKLVLSESGLSLLIASSTAAGTALVLYMGAQSILAGTLSLGSLLLVMSYLGQLYAPLRTVSSKVARLQSHLSSAERAFDMLDEVPDVVERHDAKPLARAAGEIEFRNVSFAYSTGRKVLDNVTFALEPGLRVGIAGPTGAGKTTLVNLITRFFDPTDGRVLLDGIDLREYRLADLRNQFAIVLQEPVLFSTSIGENIMYASPDARASQVIEAARAAGVHEFISALPDGYDTAVGERGLSLSGGERQRISLARAFLKDAPILVLDEPTSSVDVQTEAGIVDAMHRLMHGRTTLMIAHRLGTLSHCDILLRIEDGALVEVVHDVDAEIARVHDSLPSRGDPRPAAATG